MYAHWRVSNLAIVGGITSLLCSLYVLLACSNCNVAGEFPLFPLQSGDAKDAGRKEVRALFDQICCFYAPPKLFGYVADGLKSKNSRQRFGEKLIAPPCGVSNLK